MPESGKAGSSLLYRIFETRQFSKDLACLGTATAKRVEAKLRDYAYPILRQAACHSEARFAGRRICTFPSGNRRPPRAGVCASREDEQVNKPQSSALRQPRTNADPSLRSG